MIPRNAKLRFVNGVQVREEYEWILSLELFLVPNAHFFPFCFHGTRAMRLPDRGVIDRISQWLRGMHIEQLLYRAATLSHIMHHVCTHARP